MTVGELEAMVRQLFLDESPYADDRFVSSAEILRFLNESVDQACIRAGLIADGTTGAVCSSAVTFSQPYVSLDNRIISLNRAVLRSNNRVLTPASVTTLEKLDPYWNRPVGVPMCFISGLHTKKLRLVPIPNADDALWLDVIRRPLARLASDTDIPEIDEVYHLHLAYRALAWIYRKDDAESGNLQKADYYDGLFADAFGKPLSAASVNLFANLGEIRVPYNGV